MIKYLALLFLLAFILTGCAEIEPPSPAEILKHPLGKGPLRVGMAKDEVIALWGEPDVINRGEEASSGTAVSGTTIKEEWVYHARYSNLPINTGYLSTTKYLYFDGNNLTSFRE